MAKKQKERDRQLGSDEWEEAARWAGTCSDFVPDVEEEQVADEAVSCYNCRYRRWLADSMVCLAVLPG